MEDDTQRAEFLTEAKITALLICLYHASDKDRDGVLSFDEFKNFIHYRLEMSLSDDEIREAFDSYDTDKNGFIDFKEFTELIDEGDIRHALRDTAHYVSLEEFGMHSDMKRTEIIANLFFLLADKEGRGELRVEEIQRVFVILQGNDAPSLEQVREGIPLLTTADVTGVNRQQFRRLIELL
eukprot:gnl/Chilomastix_cuspidata/3432.p1 GENE.gnl/Chilomastix_cuspidata/3432~~gnl/Chilomastix_cuspidata/3432.p1  ORF type:complete len:181 (-),score=28.52 gnl/Chilomastix_cuspidata/3432:235-777(-)